MNHATIDIHACECEPDAKYLLPDDAAPFVAVRFEGARGAVRRWERGQITLDASLAEHCNGTVYLTPAAARRLAERILAALPAKSAVEVAA